MKIFMLRLLTCSRTKPPGLSCLLHACQEAASKSCPQMLGLKNLLPLFFKGPGRVSRACRGPKGALLLLARAVGALDISL